MLLYGFAGQKMIRQLCEVSACEARLANYSVLKAGNRFYIGHYGIFRHGSVFRAANVIWKLFQNYKCGIIIFVHRADNNICNCSVSGNAFQIVTVQTGH